MFSLVPSPFLLPLMATAVVWVLILGSAWSHPDRIQHVLPSTLWAVAVAGCTAPVAQRFGVEPVSQAIWTVGTPLLTVTLLAGVLAAVTTVRHERPRMPLIVVGVLLTGAVQLLSAAYNDQLSGTFSVKLMGIPWLPAFAVLAWLTPLSRETLLRLALRISMAVTVGSLALAVVLPGVAFIDNRRLPVPGIMGRLAGCTPHPNLLAITAGVALLLALGLRPRRWQLGVAGCIVALVLAEPRGEVVALVAALVVYWIFSGPSMPVRILVGGGAMALAWPYLSGLQDTLDGSSLGAGAATLNSRTIVWDMVLQAWPAARWLGWGPAAFSDASGSPVSTSYFLHAHSQFYESIAEGGACGLLAVGVTTVGMVMIAARCRDRPLFPALATMIVLAMASEVPLSANLYGMSFAVLVAALLVVAMVAGTKPGAGTADASGDLHVHEEPATV